MGAHSASEIRVTFANNYEATNHLSRPSHVQWQLHLAGSATEAGANRDAAVRLVARLVRLCLLTERGWSAGSR